MEFKVDKVDVKEINLIKEAAANPKFRELIQKMKDAGVKSPIDLLPPASNYVVGFDLIGCNVGFANAIRRCLIAELPVYALAFDESLLKTNDVHILFDILQTNIGLVPIDQRSAEDLEDANIWLDVYNNTNDNMEIKASDICIEPSGSSRTRPPAHIHTETKHQNSTALDTIVEYEPKSSARVIPITRLIPNSNIQIGILRRSCYLAIQKIKIVKGISDVDASKFSFLNNVTYNIIDQTPYNIETHTGTRSVEANPRHFRISYETTGNCSALHPIHLACDTLLKRLKVMRTSLNNYKINGSSYYMEDEFEVRIQSGEYEFKWQNEYITLPAALARYCYDLDTTGIEFCAFAVLNYSDSESTIRLRHADAPALILRACDLLDRDLQTLRKSF